MNYTPITPELLLELGFKEIETEEGLLYVKGETRLAFNGNGWTRCVPWIDRPLTPGPIENFTTIEDLYRLEIEVGIEDIEIWDFLQKKQSESTIDSNCPNKQITI